MLDNVIFMKKRLIFSIAAFAAALLFVGCQSLPPGAERGPHGTMAYDVLIDASPPGARVEANGEVVGNTPLHLKIYGDPDGTFHDFGSEVYVINALPVATNQFAQSRVFGTGHMFGPEDHIPKEIHFDMNQPPPAYPPGGPPAYVYPAYPPPVYYGPPVYYYGRPYYYNPGLRVYVGPRPYYHYRRY